MNLDKKLFQKTLTHIKDNHDYLLEDQEVCLKHFKLLNYEVSYEGETYKVITYTQTVANGVLLRHFIWVNTESLDLFLVNTQQKFKPNRHFFATPSREKKSTYESIGGGVSLKDDKVIIVGKNRTLMSNKYKTKSAPLKPIEAIANLFGKINDLNNARILEFSKDLRKSQLRKRTASSKFG